MNPVLLPALVMLCSIGCTLWLAGAWDADRGDGYPGRRARALGFGFGFGLGIGAGIALVDTDELVQIVLVAGVLICVYEGLRR